MSDWIDKLKEDAHSASLEEVEDALVPVGGRPIVGDLTNDEKEAYVAVYNMESDLIQLQDDLMRRHIERSLDNVRSMENITLDGIVNLSQGTKFFDNDTEASDFFHRIAEFEAKNTTFWFTVRERLNIWTQSLSVRKGWRIVSTGYKYKQ